MTFGIQNPSMHQPAPVTNAFKNVYFFVPLIDQFKMHKDKYELITFLFVYKNLTH